MRARAGYVLAGAVLAGGIGFGALTFVRQLRGIPDELQQIVVPGEHDITLPRAGAHTIFHEQRAVVGGRYFAGDRQLNGLMLRLQPMPAGEEIAIDPPSARTSYAVADREGSSIGTFQVSRPGTYRLSAWYPEAANDPTAVLAIGQGVERRVAIAVVGSIAASLGGLLGCTAIAGATFRRGRRHTGMREREEREMERRRST